jgi:hypothetical protein
MTGKQFLYFFLASTLIFLGSLVIMFLQTSIINLEDLEFIATNGNNTLYFSIHNKIVEYDILQEKNNMYLLTRYRHPKVYQALMFSNFTTITDFEELQTDLNPVQDTKITVDENNPNTLKITINDESLDIRFDLPLLHSGLKTTEIKQIPEILEDDDYIIKNFRYGRADDYTFKALKQIPTKVNEERRILMDNFKERMLNTNPPLHKDKIFIDCVVRLIDVSYTKINQAVEGTCNGLSIIAFPGTNPISTKTFLNNVFYDIYSVVDNFEAGFNAISGYNPSKVYDYAVGHSLGGGTIKWGVSNNKLKANNVLTFGSALTRNYNKNIPITQYIKTRDNNNSCCVHGWFSCRRRGQTYLDPITLVLVGSHTNPYYLNNPKFLNCPVNLPKTLFDTTFSLHIPLYYNYAVDISF